MEKKTVQKGYWQYYKMLWGRSYPKMWADVGVLSIILGIIVFTISEIIIVYNQRPTSLKNSLWSNVVIPAVITLGVWAFIILVVMFIYASKESVFVYNNQAEKIEQYFARVAEDFSLWFSRRYLER